MGSNYKPNQDPTMHMLVHGHWDGSVYIVALERIGFVSCVEDSINVVF